MGYIYKITNQINQKSYIGQTINSIKERMRKHYDHSLVATTGIDYAIHKYGKDNFIVEEICQCEDTQLDDLERYYIDLYDTYKNGYNLTIGGQDCSTRWIIDEQEVINKYNSGKTINELAIEYNKGERTISNLLHRNNIPIRRGSNPENIIGKGKQFQEGDGIKSVYIQELDLTFPSLKECAQWLIDNNYSKANSMEMARKSLSRALHSGRNSYCKLHFSFV